ncbi:nose resistant to fluoxetine protein 6-like [Vanessa atalanta]|uniref:nose resistant to fluoxetine protein 6-like n=1 Tax=Vanessa atalanta TaxID=42275 RepID=UPI001FCE2AA3|nr:nose resistant to fluoxetine protein 6-like [Vanessa atalanta]
MVCHRWTLALILFSVPLLVTVISAFRVRLPGSSHEVKSELRRHKCKDCDVNDLNLDPILDNFKKDSAKRSFEDIKKVLQDKRHLIEEKLSKTTFDKHNISEDDDDNISGLEKSSIESVKLPSDSKVKTRSKKVSVVLDFDDDDDSDIDDEDDDDDYKHKEIKKGSSIDSKKKVDKLPHIYKDVPLAKSKIIVKEKIDKHVKDDEDDGKVKEKQTDTKVHPKPKIEILPPKIIQTDTRKSKDEILKPVKQEKKDELHVEEVKKIIKSSDQILTKVTEKTTNIRPKELNIVKPPSDKVVLATKDDVTDKDHTIPKKIEKKILLKKLKEEDIEIDSTKPDKIEEKAKKVVFEKKEKIKIVAETDKKKDSEEVDIDKKTSETKSDSKDVRLQHLSDALVRRNLFKSEFEDFYSFFPTFAPNFSRIHNPECRRHGQILLRQLRGTKLWALNMLDATAKIPSGLLQGNGIQLGDFDQCLGIRARVQLDTGSVVKIQGKYCLAMVDVKAEHPDLEAPIHLAQGRNLFKSRIDDPGHFVPRFSTLSWGVCVPSPCGPEDVEVVLRDAIKHYQYKTGISVRVKVDETDCHIRKAANWWKEWLNMPTLLTLSFYAMVIILVLLATLQDYLARNTPESTEGKDEEENSSEKGEKEEIKKDKESSGGLLYSFSLYKSLGKLVAPASSDEIACIHGLRAVATIALLFAHKFLPVGLTPYTNRLRLSEIVSSPFLSWCRAGWMFTDCFLLLSGTLTSYRKSTNDTMAAKLLSRYIRLTPALLAVVLFYAYVWDDISSGPMWGALVTKNAELCQKGWWWNLFYIQNHYGFEDMCAPQTHHMALDFQLTIIGGIIVWAIQSEVPFSSTVMPILHLLSAYSRYTTFRDHRLSVLAYQGISVSQLYRTGRLSYTSVLHRCSPYFIGLSLGLALRKPSSLTKFVNILGWFISINLMGLVLWAGGDSGYFDYRYDVTFASLYATLAPLATALAIAWLVYSVHNGHSEMLSTFLSSRPLLFISRISYALYLVQFIVFLTNTATIRAPKEFSLLSLIDLQELLTILMGSIILTITLVIPLQSLPKLSFGSNPDEKEDNKEPSDAEPVQNNKNTEQKIERDEHVKETPQLRRSFLAHREVLEEIPEVEVEYEIQRDSNEGLEEILEEEDEEEEDRETINEEDLEIIEEEQGESGEDFWAGRRQFLTRRTFSNDQDLDEWEWTANGNERTGSQEYRYNR